MRAKGRKHSCATARQMKHSETMFKVMFREEAIAAQQCQCTYCKDKLPHQKATADHLTAKSKGGFTQRKNIKAACKACNLAKGTMSEANFRKLLHSPSIPLNFQHALAWMRFRLNNRIIKAEKRIAKYVGIKLR